jgi:hypothetical protein
VGEEGVGRALLDDAALVEHDDAVHQGRDGEHVVADDEQGGAGRGEGRIEQAEHAGGDARVERAGRLVGQQQAGAGHQRAGERDALALADAELRRVAAGVDLAEPDLGQRAPHRRLTGLARPAPGAACAHVAQRLGDDLLERPARIEGGHRILEEHAEARARRADDGARRRAAVAAHHREQGRLAATGIAHQRDPLAGEDVEADAGQGRRRAVAHGDIAERNDRAGSRLAGRLDSLSLWKRAGVRVAFHASRSPHRRPFRGPPALPEGEGTWPPSSAASAETQVIRSPRGLHRRGWEP